MSDEGEDLRQAGRDEMNLAEYPITWLETFQGWFRDLPGMVLETFQGWFGIRLETFQGWFRDLPGMVWDRKSNFNLDLRIPYSEEPLQEELSITRPGGGASCLSRPGGRSCATRARTCGALAATR